MKDHWNGKEGKGWSGAGCFKETYKMMVTILRLWDWSYRVDRFRRQYKLEPIGLVIDWLNTNENAQVSDLCYKAEKETDISK